jgi:hypothetical protein
MIKNFQLYYFRRKASKLIRDYVHSCITCAYAGKYDMKKIKPSTERTLQPVRPRQHMYCDLIPMPKGQFSYILFCLDAYSQFIYAIPLKDKTAPAVLQGFLALFATTGWYESLYLDNETSFQKVAKLLVKIAPMSIHYSSPYCHFQNNAENYIKSFKRNFLKILNDSENPQENKDWALLLPTVVQSLNRQVIQPLGITRESLHYNMKSVFYPLAEISSEANSDFDQVFDAMHPNVYAQVKKFRDKSLAKSHKAKVPEFYENQVVFAIDQSPMSPGVSSILRLPTRGPFRISKLEERNVTLIDLETGKEYSSHVELIRPLSLSEFKLILSKDWDLNVQNSKAPKTVATRSSFSTPSNQMLREDVEKIEEEIKNDEETPEIKDLFDHGSLGSVSLLNPELQAEPKPPDIKISDLDGTEHAEFNCIRLEEDLSPSYKKSILKKAKETRNVRFREKIREFFKL